MDNEQINQNNWDIQIPPKRVVTPNLNAPQKRKTKTPVFVFILVLLLILALGAAYYFYKNSGSVVINKIDNTPEAQLQSAISEISKVAVLPTNDTPNLAIVSDPEQLREDPFFDEASVGDMLLVYPRLGKAYLYNPTLKKIVNIAVFPIDEPSSSTSTVNNL